MLERDVAAYLKKRLAALGGGYRRVEWTGHRGAPDMLALLDYDAAHRLATALQPDTMADRESSRRFVLLTQCCHPMIETKAPGQVPEEHQLREHERLRAAGIIVLVIDSYELVDRYFPLP